MSWQGPLVVPNSSGGITEIRGWFALPFLRREFRPPYLFIK
jgi:hypothetical protein